MFRHVIIKKTYSYRGRVEKEPIAVFTNENDANEYLTHMKAAAHQQNTSPKSKWDDEGIVYMVKQLPI